MGLAWGVAVVEAEPLLLRTDLSIELKYEFVRLHVAPSRCPVAALEAKRGGARAAARGLRVPVPQLILVKPRSKFNTAVKGFAFGDDEPPCLWDLT